MIVKNEEAVLERCLKSVEAIADEIVIVDTGSKDRTKEIAKKFTDRVYNFKWVNDFSKARNFAFSKGTKDYLMWLDADDIILEPDREQLLLLKETLAPDCDIVTARYNVGFDGSGNVNFFSTRGRLFKRANNPTWQDEIHEYIPLIGKIYAAPHIAITHSPLKKAGSDRNIKIYESVLRRDGKLSPRGKYYYARELKDHGRLQEAAEYFELFLDEDRGWSEDNIAACFNCADCYRTLGDRNLALRVLKRSFDYAAPRAEICCSIAYLHKDNENYRLATEWFETAVSLPENTSIGFVLPDYAAYVPLLELAVCYDRLGQREKAIAANERAGAIRPNSPAYLHNKKYFGN
jgi:glycosyltransferase involved in cell wall biosynthesis